MLTLGSHPKQPDAKIAPPGSAAPGQVICLLMAVLLVSFAGRGAAQALPSQAAFFQGLKQLCGRSFEGSTQFPDNPDHPMAGKRLVVTIESCTEKEIRIPFHVGEDKSRTWVLTLDERGLLFKHDHRHPDGTPDEVTDYGGWAAGDETAHRQRFPADEETKRLIPEAATNVWMLEFDPDRRTLVYYLERHGEPRYRARFTLMPPAG